MSPEPTGILDGLGPTVSVPSKADRVLDALMGGWSNSPDLKGFAVAESSEEFAQLRNLKAKCTAFEERRDRLLKELLRNEQDFGDARRNYTDRFNSLAPIHASLPNEILLNVFHRAQDEDKATGIPAYPRIESVLSQVCARWRSLALSTPSLWDFLHLRANLSVDRTVAYLALSQQQPIDVSVEVRKVVDDLGEDVNGDISLTVAEAQNAATRFLDTILPILLPALPRCRRFFVESGVEAILGGMREYLEVTALPLLETLRVESFPFPWCPPLGIVPPSIIPNPTTTGIHRLRPNPDTLVHLRLEKALYKGIIFFNLPRSVLDRIFALPRLESLSLLGPVLNANAEDNEPHTQAWESHSLKHLRCGGWRHDADLAHHVLSNLSAPNLESVATARMRLDAGSLIVENETCRFPSLKTLVFGLEGATALGHQSVRCLQRVLALARSVEHLVVEDILTLTLVTAAAAQSETLPGVKEVTILSGDVHADTIRLMSGSWPHISVLRVPEDPQLMSLPSVEVAPGLILTSVEKIIPPTWKTQWNAQLPDKRSFPWPCPQAKHWWETREDGSQVLKTKVSWPFDGWHFCR